MIKRFELVGYLKPKMADKYLYFRYLIKRTE